MHIQTSPATTITYLTAGIIYIGSHFGDSQVVRITPSPDPMIGVQLDVLDTHKNIAPIMDAILVDTENLGQVVPHELGCTMLLMVTLSRKSLLALEPITLAL